MGGRRSTARRCSCRRPAGWCWRSSPGACWRPMSACRSIPGPRSSRSCWPDSPSATGSAGAWPTPAAMPRAGATPRCPRLALAAVAASPSLCCCGSGRAAALGGAVADPRHRLARRGPVPSSEPVRRHRLADPDQAGGRRAPAEHGEAIGRMYALGAVGAIAGTLATGYLFIAWIGSIGTVVAVAAVYAALAAAFASAPRAVARRGGPARDPRLGLRLCRPRGRGPSSRPVPAESDYYCIRIDDFSSQSGRPSAVMVLDHLAHGINDRDDPRLLYSTYLHLLDELRAGGSDNRTPSVADRRRRIDPATCLAGTPSGAHPRRRDRPGRDAAARAHVGAARRALKSARRRARDLQAAATRAAVRRRVRRCLPRHLDARPSRHARIP